MERKELARKAKNIGKKLLSINKYLVALLLGVFIVGFVGDNCVVAHLQKKNRISELKAEIAHYDAMTKANLEEIALLKNSPKALERVARERYFMKMEDEDVFVLSDDQLNAETPIGDETVE
jgi:cell division protein FtsB